MSQGQWISVVASLMLLAFFVPAILRMPREGMLRNIAIWLGIFVVLGLLYNAFGPF